MYVFVFFSFSSLKLQINKKIPLMYTFFFIWNYTSIWNSRVRDSFVIYFCGRFEEILKNIHQQAQLILKIKPIFWHEKSQDTLVVGCCISVGGALLFTWRQQIAPKKLALSYKTLHSVYLFFKHIEKMYISSKIRKTQNEHLNIACQNLNSL